jgi:hypothetical protein
MKTHNNYDYFITYILFSCIGHEEVLLQFQQTNSTVHWCPLQQKEVATQLHIPYWSILIDKSFYCSMHHFIV